LVFESGRTQPQGLGCFVQAAVEANQVFHSLIEVWFGRFHATERSRISAKMQEQKK
jgi:hypothetical protein